MYCRSLNGLYHTMYHIPNVTFGVVMSSQKDLLAVYSLTGPIGVNFYI